jgi:hypothetical protein
MIRAPVGPPRATPPAQHPRRNRAGCRPTPDVQHDHATVLAGMDHDTPPQLKPARRRGGTVGSRRQVEPPRATPAWLASRNSTVAANMGVNMCMPRTCQDRSLATPPPPTQTAQAAARGFERRVGPPRATPPSHNTSQGLDRCRPTWASSSKRTTVLEPSAFTHTSSTNRARRRWRHGTGGTHMGAPTNALLSLMVVWVGSGDQCPVEPSACAQGLTLTLPGSQPVSVKVLYTIFTSFRSSLIHH